MAGEMKVCRSEFYALARETRICGVLKLIWLNKYVIHFIELIERASSAYVLVTEYAILSSPNSDRFHCTSLHGVDRISH